MRKEEIKRLISELKDYNILNNYVNFKCRTADNYSYFYLKTKIFDWEKIYTTEHLMEVLEFNIEIHGDTDVFHDMTVLELITLKNVNSIEIFVKKITKDENFEVEKTLIGTHKVN